MLASKGTPEKSGTTLAILDYVSAEGSFLRSALCHCSKPLELVVGLVDVELENKRLRHALEQQAGNPTPSRI